MKNQKLTVLFVIKPSKINKKGLCPLNIRITYLKERKEASSGLMVNPSHWNSKQQKFASKSNSGQQVNQQLEITVAAIRKAYLQLQLSEVEFTVEDIFHNYVGKPSKKEVGTIQYFKEFLAKKKKLIGIDIQLVTWKKFHYVCTQAQDFIKWKYGKNDLPMNKLKLQFLKDFEHYLKTETKQRQVTLNKAIQRLRKPIKEAVDEGSLVSDICTPQARKGQKRGYIPFCG